MEKVVKATNSFVIKLNVVEWQWNDFDIITNPLMLATVYGNDTAITVKFDTDGGSVIETQTVKYGETVVNPSDPQKEGVVFSRWELNGEPYDFSSPVKQNITLKAVYKPEKIIPGKIGYFDEKFGESQFKVVNSKIEFTTEKAYGEEVGSLKVTVLPGYVHTFGKLVKLTEVDVSAYDSLVLRVFNPNNYEAYFFLAEEGVSTTMDYLLKPNEWTEVRIPISRLSNAKDLMGLDFKVAQKNFASLEPNTTIYLSAMYAEKDQNSGPSEVVPGKLCYFDEQYGVAQFAADHVAIEFSSDTKHGDEAGSLKLTVQTGNNGNIGHLLNLTETDLSGYKVAKFYVYNPGTEDMWFATEGKWFSVLKEGKEENAQEVRCIAGEWTEVSINLSAITAAGKRLEEVALKANAFNWAALADDSTFYLSSVNAS